MGIPSLYCSADRCPKKSQFDNFACAHAQILAATTKQIQDETWPQPDESNPAASGAAVHVKEIAKSPVLHAFEQAAVMAATVDCGAEASAASDCYRYETYANMLSGLLRQHIAGLRQQIIE